ncbi:MAG: UDP-N-acetylmuramate dehydrogenase [Flavobacteriales bacterium]|jgi:UDP-N-acetylmuramate dehydrogenase|nr:UDP-N-acetylmuramate dehydrogenase [Flavobacteriales bacterium]
MQIYHNISLKNYHTFGIEQKAKTLIEIEHEDEIPQISEMIEGKEYLVIGQGSNLLFTKDFEGIIIHQKQEGVQIERQDDKNVWITVEAGKNWHEFVKWSLDHQCFGLENMALIPGTVGASPVQNVGAYGKEAKDFVVSVRAFNLVSNKWEDFTHSDCEFEYRNSFFKKNLGKYLVSKVRFKLHKEPVIDASYGAIQNVLNKNGIQNPQPIDIFNAVVEIRNSKLPNPQEIGNAGSFFKNPVITKQHWEKILKKYPDAKHYPLENGMIKIPAGWMLDRLGWKGKKFDDFGVYDKQALVLVNYGSARGEEIQELAKKIIRNVKEEFEIDLEPEVQMF